MPDIVAGMPVNWIELDENSWMVGDITPARFFEIPNDNLWEASMSGLGGRYRIWANFPKDPIMN